jgi:prepilin-type N-terminal cleavage/methylation domain-containing protein
MRNSGFTLIEILMVIGIIAVIASFGMLMSMDFYRGFAFRSEQNTLVSVLTKARNKAMANINEKPHGVRVEQGKYIIFEGAAYDPLNPNNIEIKAAPNVSNNGPVTVVFEQLSGDVPSAYASEVQIILTSEGRSSVVSLNSLGRINW